MVRPARPVFPGPAPRPAPSAPRGHAPFVPVAHVAAQRAPLPAWAVPDPPTSSARSAPSSGGTGRPPPGDAPRARAGPAHGPQPSESLPHHVPTLRASTLSAPQPRALAPPASASLAQPTPPPTPPAGAVRAAPASFDFSAAYRSFPPRPTRPQHRLASQTPSPAHPSYLSYHTHYFSTDTCTFCERG